MPTPSLHDFATVTLSALGALAIKATILLLLVIVASRMLARASAATRHGMWTLSVVALLALPLAQAFLPSIEAPLPYIPRVAPTQTRVAKSSPVPPARERATARPARATTEPTAAQPAAPSRLLPSWKFLALLTWASGVVAVLGFFGLGQRALSRAVRRSRPLQDDTWLRLAGEIRVRLGIRRNILLLVGEPGTAPMTWGTRRPVILLPESALGWPPEQRRAVLVHEMGHVARMDCAIQEMAHVACALYWLHPGVWLLARRLRVERERACDDLVLADGAVAGRYAEDLVAAVRATRWLHRSHGVAAASMAAPSRLEERIRAILDPSQDRRPVSRRSRWIAGALAAGIALPLATIAPRVPAASPAPSAGAGLAARWDTAVRDARGEGAVWLAYAIPFGGGHDGKETLFSDSEEGHFDEIGLNGTPLAERHGFENDDAVFLFRVSPKTAGSRVPFDRIAIRSGRLAHDTQGLRVVSLGRMPVAESLDWLRARFEAAPDDDRARVLVMAVSVHDIPATPLLLEAVLDGSRASPIRAQAAEGLARHPSSRSLEDLVRHARRDRSLEVRRESAEAVGDLDYPPATGALIQLARDVENEDVRAEAVEALGVREADQVIDVLVSLAADDPSERVKCEAVETLGDLPDHAGLAALRRIVKDHPSERVRNEAFETLNGMTSERP